MKRLISLAGLAALSLGVALPILAQERPGDKPGERMDKTDKMEKGCEEVSIDKPYGDVVRRLPEAIKDANLIYAGEIDWQALSHRAMPPHGGTAPKLDAAATNVKTFLLTDEKCVNEVLSEPKHGFFVGKLVICEEGGKIKLFAMKPTVHLEQAKKAGMITEEKYEKHLKDAQEYEKRLENVINILKGEKRS